VRLDRWRYWPLLLFFGFYLLPVGLASLGHWFDGERPRHWWQARTDSTGLAPDPVTTPEAVVQVYGARAFRWRGIFGVHTWVAIKPRDGDSYTRLEVMGWGVSRGAPAVRVRQGIAPDGYWFGALPEVLTEHRGELAEQLIERLLVAVAQYPHASEYRVWPGPNSNTFVAHLGRRVPELALDLPPTAIGKDYLGQSRWLGRAPSGGGMQLSLGGYLGVLVAPEEGVEINLLGLAAGVDFFNPALRLPGLGRIGVGTGERALAR